MEVQLPSDSSIPLVAERKEGGANARKLEEKNLPLEGKLEGGVIARKLQEPPCLQKGISGCA